MTLRLVDTDWGAELTDALRADTSTLRIVSPVIKAGSLERLLALKPKSVEVITRLTWRTLPRASATSKPCARC